MEFTAIASGYTLLEAPRAQSDAVWFADLGGGGIHRLRPGGTPEVFLPGTKNIGGIVLNHDGRLVCGGHEAIFWLDPETGQSGTIIDSLNGAPFPGSNDMIPDGKGGLYFGTVIEGADYTGEPGPTSLYRLDPSGRVALQSDGLRFANGCGLSPDGKLLYHDESQRGCYVYDVSPDGSLANKRMFAAQEDCDGLAVDAEGGVWIACFLTGQIVRYRPDGTLDRGVPVPQAQVTSLCFGGEDMRDVYVTTAGNRGITCMMTGEPLIREACLYHARSDIPGLPVHVTRFELP